MDSAEIPVYGEPEQSAYNGHFKSTCYYPLVLLNREGDCLAAKLRPGNVHSAEDREELLYDIPQNGEVSKKTASGSCGDDFSGLTEGLWAVDVTAGRQNVLARTQVDVYFQLPEGQNVNSG